jgi:hypothetical protein
MEEEMNNCSICQVEFSEYECSGWPIVDGPCCPRCDDLIVTVARMMQAADPGAGALMVQMEQRAITMRRHKLRLTADMLKQRKRKAKR